MIIDTSALICILLGEPEAEEFAKAIACDWKRLMSSVNALEAAIVIEAKKGDPGSRELDLLLARSKIEIVPFDLRTIRAGQNGLAKLWQRSPPCRSEHW